MVYEVVDIDEESIAKTMDEEYDLEVDFIVVDIYYMR